MWVNLINGKKYIGQTQDLGGRFVRYNSGDFNPYMSKAIAKYGIDNFEIIILEKDVDFEELDCLEQYYMDYYKSYNKNYGYNLCKKAGSTRGIIRSAETRQKMSEIAFNRFKNEGGTFLGKKHSEETKKKMSDIALNRTFKPYKEVAVDCYDMMGQYVCTYENVKTACYIVNGKSPSAISACINNKAKTAFGFIWVVHGEDFVYDESKYKRRKNGKKEVSISCFTEDGVFVNSYSSIKEASGYNNAKYCKIQKCLNGYKKTALGYVWKYKDDC